MAISRASLAVLRSGVRPVTATAPLRLGQVRRATIRSDGNLGGPGGQKAPPPNPGGPEALKRNWIPIAGGAVLAVAALSYMTSPSPGNRPPRTLEGDLKAASSTEIGMLPPPTGRGIAKALEDKESKALSELSGRKGRDGMGSFRAE